MPHTAKSFGSEQAFQDVSVQTEEAAITLTRSISLMGLVVAMLSVMGVVIWWKKRMGRIRSTQRTGSVSAVLPVLRTA